MNDNPVLRVGSIEMPLADVGHELLAAFRDDMLQYKHVRIRHYWSQFGRPADDDPVITLQEYRVIGQALADRLDLMGFDKSSTLAMTGGAIAATEALGSLGIVGSDEAALAGRLDSAAWVDCLRESTDYLLGVSGPDLRSRSWLLDLISGCSFMRRLRAILLAFPHAEVILDHAKADRLSHEEFPAWNSQQAAAALQHRARAHAPVVVLTEGRTDAEFLEAALAILYPHLTDVIKFLDYDRRPEGGAGSVVNAIRAFSAAGIANRVVALLDNDTGAAEALSNLDMETCTSHIQVLRYPNLELAESYPTLGTPSLEFSSGVTVPANINGLAGIIELYLGRDILMQDDGSLQPIQWTSRSSKMQQYQGEITNKAGLHKKFRAKYKEAMANPAAVASADWSGLQLILDALREAAVRAQHSADG